MALWDVQVDARDGRVVAVRPAGFRHWGTGDDVPPLKINRAQDLGLTYDRTVAVSLDAGGNGTDKSERELRAAEALPDAPLADVAKELPRLTVAQLDAEIQRRGYKPISLAQIMEP